MYEAAQFLGMSFIELERDPEKYLLMGRAFTLQSGIHNAEQIIKADMESKAKVNGKA